MPPTRPASQPYEPLYTTSALDMLRFMPTNCTVEPCPNRPEPDPLAQALGVRVGDDDLSSMVHLPDGIILHTARLAAPWLDGMGQAGDVVQLIVDSEGRVRRQTLWHDQGGVEILDDDDAGRRRRYRRYSSTGRRTVDVHLRLVSGQVHSTVGPMLVDGRRYNAAGQPSGPAARLGQRQPAGGRHPATHITALSARLPRPAQQSDLCCRPEFHFDRCRYGIDALDLDALPAPSCSLLRHGQPQNLPLMLQGRGLEVRQTRHTLHVRSGTEAITFGPDVIAYRGSAHHGHLERRGNCLVMIDSLYGEDLRHVLHLRDGRLLLTRARLRPQADHSARLALVVEQHTAVHGGPAVPVAAGETMAWPVAG